MKNLVPDNVASLTEAQLLHAFIDIYEGNDLTDALRQWATQMIFEGYDVEQAANSSQQ